MKRRIEIAPGVSLAYTLDDYTDPWTDAETIILIHGIAESGEAWRAWVPHLARRYKVIRLDLRGFGDSTPMPLDYEWSIAALADDLDAFVTRLDLGRVHLVRAKLGGLISMKFAATRPQNIPDSELVLIPASSFHISASYPDACASYAAELLARRKRIEP